MEMRVFAREGERRMFLEIKDISKKIGEDYVLREINLSMDKGRIYGLQGKNGCGKSMLMRVICGLVLPTEGKVIIDGEELGKDISFPRSIGVLIEKPGFLDSYSGYQNLKMLASIQGRVEEEGILKTIQRVGLEDVMHKKYRKYSWHEAKVGDCSSDSGKTGYCYLR